MDKDSKIYKIRHSLSHILAQAVLEMFPEAKLGYGPPVENGFYYDFELPRPLVPEDLPILEKKMKHFIKQNQSFEMSKKPIDEAMEFIKSINQIYKQEGSADLKASGETEISFCENKLPNGNPTFVDMCEGHHVEKTNEIPENAFKLDRIAGAYWKGEAERPMLTRIYGLAFETKAELDEFLNQRTEAEKRDHRKLGQSLKIFFTDEIVGKGLVMWQPNGTIIRDEIEKLAREKEANQKYLRVITPHLAKEELFLKSGHLPYYKDDMYPAMVMDDGTYYLKAMNCPHHHIMYGHEPHSYKDLPLRLAEYGTVYRNELSGTLAGLLRVRCLAMNDAHIYCRKDQIKEEFENALRLTMEYFEIFGLKDYWFRLSKWDPKRTDKYINEPDNWEYSEKTIREILDSIGVKYIEVEDEAAFYGPKVDIQFKSIIGRTETMSTVQLDFAAKTRFNLMYKDSKGEDNNEVFVIHRAPLSTHERFIAFLIEHFAGAFPTWLAPTQVRILPVSDKFLDYANEVQSSLLKENVRVEMDDSSESLGKKIRNAELMKIPYMIVIGEKEVEQKELAIRNYHTKDQNNINLESFMELITDEIRSRKLPYTQKA